MISEKPTERFFKLKLNKLIIVMKRTTLKTKIITPESLDTLTIPLWFNADEFDCMKSFQRYYPELKLKSWNCFYEFRKVEQNQQKLFNCDKQLLEVDYFVKTVLTDFPQKTSFFLKLTFISK